MARITVYRAGAWHEFHGYKDIWMGTEPSVVVIPEQENKRNVAQAFTYLNTDAVLTIPELIARYIQRRGGKGLLAPHVLEAFIGTILTETFVPHLQMEDFRPSYIRALADFIYNFRRTSLVGLQEAMTGFKAGSLSLKESDLIKIYSEYASKLPDYGFDLSSGLADFLAQTGADNIHRDLGIGANEGVIFLGFDYLNPLEEEFIFTVFKYARRACFLGCAEPAASEQAMRIQESVAALLERLNHLGVEQQILPPPQQAPFIDLSRSIFRPDLPASREKPHAPAPKVSISQANTRLQEVIAIAKRIRRLGDAGVALSRIRVVAPAYPIYSSIIAEVFPEYHIAFSLEQGVPLLRFPLATVILQMVSQGVSPNPYPLREKALVSPYISFSEEVSPQDLAAYQQTSGVELLNPERLTARLKPQSYRLDFSYLKHIRREAYRTVKPAPGIPQLEVVKRYLDGVDWKNSADQEEHLGQCLVQFYLLARAEKALSAWPSRMSGAEFKDTLQGMLDRLHVAQNIELAGDTSLALTVRARDRAVLSRIDGLLAEMVASGTAAKQGPAEKFTLAELSRIFARLLGDASLFQAEYAPGGDTGVVVQPVSRGQYDQWGYTFICGMVDGEFPAAESFNFLQPQKEGLGLGQAYTSVDHGRSRFYHLVRSTASALFLSRPLSDNGKRLPPSPFLREIEQCMAADLPETEDTATAACRDKLYGQREKLLLIGKNADHHDDSARLLLQELKDEDEAFCRHVAEILRFDGLTLNTAGLSEFDGLFGPEQPSSPPAASALALLAGELSNITFTPAVLERYAACPLRFFFDDLLGLKQGADYDPDSTETGILVRSILKEYTAKACATRSVPDDSSLFFLQAIARHLQEQQGADAFHVRYVNGLTAGLDGQAAGRRGLFLAFLEYEQNGPDFLSPYWSQLAGVVNLEDELQVQVEIDRVDLAGATGYLLPFCYTSAGTGDPGKIRRGLRFDLPLAILLCRDYVAQKQLDLAVAGAGLYQVKTVKTIRRSGYFALSGIRAKRQAGASPDQPVFSGQREGFMEMEQFTQALAKCQDQIRLLYRLMHQGVFHLPLCLAVDQSCPNCTFGRLCRKDQLRLEKLRNSCTADSLNGEKVHLVRDIF